MDTKFLFSASFRDMTTTAAAPSLMPEAFPKKEIVMLRLCNFGILSHRKVSALQMWNKAVLFAFWPYFLYQDCSWVFFGLSAN